MPVTECASDGTSCASDGTRLRQRRHKSAPATAHQCARALPPIPPPAHARAAPPLAHGARQAPFDQAPARTALERRLGEMLKATPKATGGQPYQATGSNVAPVDRAPTLADLGIDKKTSAPARTAVEPVRVLPSTRRCESIRAPTSR